MPGASNLEIFLAHTAGLRESLGPDPGDDRALPEACERCKRVFWRWKGRRRHTCPECSMILTLRTAGEVQGKVGPAYEKSVIGQLAHWSAEAQRIGLLSPGQRDEIGAMLARYTHVAPATNS